MQSRREFLQLASITAMLIGSNYWNSVAAKQQITESDLLKFDAKGQITLLHLTDIHGQLKPVYFRPPSENFGIGKYEGIPPHLVGKTFLDYFGIAPNTPLAYAHTMLDYVPLAREYGKLGGLDRTASLIKKIRAERGEDKVLLLDGGDTWQGSYTSLKTQGEDMLEAMKLMKPDAMVGHWEFTLGQERLNELIEKIDFPFLGGNVFDTEWDEPVFESTSYFEKGGVKIAVIGQHFPYTPIANPRYLVEGWSFGIRPEIIQENIDKAKNKGAEVIVLLSHNGFDVDHKLANMLDNVDVILTGHTHDAIPRAIKIKNTLLLSSGSHGKYLGRIDLKVKNGKVVDSSSNLIPIFSDIIQPDPEMTRLIDKIREPYQEECNRVVGQAETLLYRRGNFGGPWDGVICDAIIQKRDVQISLSPGFRWGTTLLPGQKITIDDIYSQTSMNYPEVYRTEMNGETIKNLLEDVCDNIFNPDPFFQQGGDMVRVGGMSYTCHPKNKMGNRISDLSLLSSGEKIEAQKKYTVGGWGSINPNVEGPAIYNVLEDYILDKQNISPIQNNPVTIKGI
ncbi:thiosulfohydrolase SoxB [SAR116 cluster bacterium]|nr:thiosulfohydrolase SoxB [SAR116 cluster bacterium]